MSQVSQEPHLESQTDFDLVDRSLKGETEAFNQLVQKYQRPIYFTALRMVSEHEEAADIAQQTFMNAFHALRKFRRQSSFKTWLCQIAINLCRNNIRNKTRRPHFLDITEMEIAEGSSSLDDLENRDLSSLVHEAISTLPEQQRLAVVLRVYEGYSYEQIAKALGCLCVTARTHFHHGILNLRKRLEGK